MEEKELKEFIYFITHNKGLSRAQISRRDALLLRDLSGLLPTIQERNQNDASNSSSSQDSTNMPNYSIKHNPRTIVSFLRQFSENKKTLRYTTHFWDKDSDGNYNYDSFEDFKNQYLKELNSKDNNLNLYLDIKPLCPHLSQLILNYLVNDEPGHFWSKHKIQIGWNYHLKDWMDKNHGKQPFSMPLSEFPEAERPKTLIKGKTLVYFNDINNIFKSCIEFRDNDLYYTIRFLFNHHDLKIDKTALETLKGCSFYTDTELVSNAMNIIHSNMVQRSGFPNIKISGKHIEQNGIKCIQIRFLQQDSYSNRDITDQKLTGKDGDIKNIITYLKNLCDYSVESNFRINGELKHCRINYLINENDNQPSYEILDEPCEGYTSILTFYTE